VTAASQGIRPDDAGYWSSCPQVPDLRVLPYTVTKPGSAHPNSDSGPHRKRPNGYCDAWCPRPRWLACRDCPFATPRAPAHDGGKPTPCADPDRIRSKSWQRSCAPSPDRIRPGPVGL